MDNRRHLTHGAVQWLVLAGILLVGGYLRFTNLNWDEGQWIHPDEGHMRIITSVVQMPDSLALYFDTHQSPLNPRNQGHTYSYGTLPLFLTRWSAEWMGDHICGPAAGGWGARAARLLLGDSAESCHSGTFTTGRSAEVGRFWSALADLGTVLLVFLIGRRLYGRLVGLLAAGFAALTAFSIQQAHFFTVDSLAAFFTVLTAYFAIRAGQAAGSEGTSEIRASIDSWGSFALAGAATGLAAACKVSAALAAGLVVLAGIWWALQVARRRSRLSTLSLLFGQLFLAGVLALLAFRFAQPYAFEGPGFFGLRPSPEWFQRLDQIQAEQSGEIDFPSGRQWTNRAPILFPWVNMVVWGLGIPLGLTAWAGWAVAGVELLRGKLGHLVLWTWVTLMFLYQATSWVKAMRYFVPLYPFMVIFAAYVLWLFIRSPNRWRHRVGVIATIVVIAGAVVWASAVFSIYQRPNTRVAASRWIIDNVPAGVTVANEHWDWGLPLRVDGRDPFSGMYTGFEMEHYNEDTPEKRTQLYAWLDKADYVFLASNRLYASISRLPTRYPLTTEYYRALLAGELGFELVADFTSRPSIGPLQFPDQEVPYPLMGANYEHQREPIKAPLPPAEEAFSVYDHPRVLIFRKVPPTAGEGAYSRERVEALLGGIDVTQAQVGLTPQEATPAAAQVTSAPILCPGLVVLTLAGWAGYRRIRQTGQ
jgi:4-amino-4-deoxy-L-arabinose transferase-like glycosyltransferase